MLFFVRAEGEGGQSSQALKWVRNHVGFRNKKANSGRKLLSVGAQMTLSRTIRQNMVSGDNRPVLYG